MPKGVLLFTHSSSSNKGRLEKKMLVWRRRFYSSPKEPAAAAQQTKQKQKEKSCRCGKGPFHSSSKTKQKQKRDTKRVRQEFTHGCSTRLGSAGISQNQNTPSCEMCLCVCASSAWRHAYTHAHTTYNITTIHHNIHELWEN